MRSIMDVKDKIRFPMSPETFIEIQEYLSCKTIDDKDKGISVNGSRAYESAIR